MWIKQNNIVQETAAHTTVQRKGRSGESEGFTDSQNG